MLQTTNDSDWVAKQAQMGINIMKAGADADKSYNEQRSSNMKLTQEQYKFDKWKKQLKLANETTEIPGQGQGQGQGQPQQQEQAPPQQQQAPVAQTPSQAQAPAPQAPQAPQQQYDLAPKTSLGQLAMGQGQPQMSLGALPDQMAPQQPQQQPQASRGPVAGSQPEGYNFPIPKSVAKALGGTQAPANTEAPAQAPPAEVPAWQKTAELVNPDAHPELRNLISDPKNMNQVDTSPFVLAGGYAPTHETAGGIKQDRVAFLRGLAQQGMAEDIPGFEAQWRLEDANAMSAKSAQGVARATLLHSQLDAVKGIKDPQAQQAAFDLLRQQAIAAGENPATIPTKYSDDYNDSVAERVLTVKEQKEQSHKDANEAIDKITAQAHADTAKAALIKAEREPNAPKGEIRTQDGPEGHGDYRIDPITNKRTFIGPINEKAEKVDKQAQRDAQISDISEETATPQEKLRATRLLNAEEKFQTETSRTPVSVIRSQDLARQREPGYDAATAERRAAIRKDFTSGGDADTIDRIRTASRHLGTAMDSLNKIPSAGPLTSAVLGAAGAFGNKNVTGYNATMLPLSRELTGAYAKLGGTKEEVESFRDSMTSGSVPQRKEATAQLVELLDGKVRSMESRYARENNGKEFGIADEQYKLNVNRVMKEAGRPALYPDAVPGAKATTPTTAPEAPLAPGKSTKVIYDAEGKSHTAKLSADGKRWEL